jgi:hypothetical protein
MSVSSDTSPSFSSNVYAPDRLLGVGPHRTQTVTILSGQVLARGAVLGMVTASSKYLLSLTAAADGSQTPRAICAVDVDATGGDKEGQVFVEGEFNETELVLGAAHTVTTIREPLRGVGIITKKPVPAPV